jgi:hypothetical protein
MLFVILGKKEKERANADGIYEHDIGGRKYNIN